MTKKDYIIVAGCMNQIYKQDGKQWEEYRKTGFKTLSNHHASRMSAIMDLLGIMFTEFEKDNPKFDWQKFKKAVYK